MNYKKSLALASVLANLILLVLLVSLTNNRSINFNDAASDMELLVSVYFNLH